MPHGAGPAKAGGEAQKLSVRAARAVGGGRPPQAHAGLSSLKKLDLRGFLLVGPGFAFGLQEDDASIPMLQKSLETVFVS